MSKKEFSFMDRVRIATTSVIKGASGIDVVMANLGWTTVGSGLGSGDAAMVRAYGTMPWLSGVVGKISDNVAVAPWYLETYKRGEKTIDPVILKRCEPELKKTLMKKMAVESNEIYDHPLLDVLSNPNPWMIGFDLMKLTSIFLDLVGEAFWYVAGDIPDIELYAIPPAWILERPSKPGDPYKLNIGKESSLKGSNGLPKEIPYERVIAFRIPRPSNPYKRTLGISNSIADELEADEYSAKYIKAFFENGAKPDIIISGTGLTKQEVERAEQRWISKLRGYMKSHMPHFLSKAVTVTELGSSFKDNDIVNLRKWQRDIVMQVFGIPPEIMGVIESSNRATISAAAYLFTKQVVLPRLNKIRMTLQYTLVPMFDSKLVLSYASPVEEDKEFRLKVMEIAPWCWTIDQWREVVGDAPLVNGQGDHVMIPAQYVPTHVTEIENFVSPYTADGLVTTQNGSDENAKMEDGYENREG